MVLDSFCKIQSIGRVGPTPSITFRDDGSVMASFKVSTSLPMRTHACVAERIVWHNVIAFGAVAEFVRDHVPEGTKVYFEGTVYPSFATDARGTRTPQLQLAAFRVLPLTTREDRAKLTRQLAQAPPLQIDPQPVDRFADDPF